VNRRRWFYPLAAVLTALAVLLADWLTGRPVEKRPLPPVRYSGPLEMRPGPPAEPTPIAPAEPVVPAASPSR